MLLCAPNTEISHCRLKRGLWWNRHVSPNTHFRDWFRIRNKNKVCSTCQTQNLQTKINHKEAFSSGIALHVKNEHISEHHTLNWIHWKYQLLTNKYISPNIPKSLSKSLINKPLTGATHFWCLAIETKVSSCWHARHTHTKLISCFLDTIVQLLDKLHLLRSEGHWTFFSTYLTHTPQYQPGSLYLQLQQGLRDTFSVQNTMKHISYQNFLLFLCQWTSS